MTNIKNIINKHRTQLEAAGFLRRLQEANPSERVRKMRPSLRKVSAALQEDPELLRRNVQPSPMSVLFEEILPKIEYVLIELGEVRTEETINGLCEYSKATIEKSGLEGSRTHLEGLFRYLLGYLEKLREKDGINRIIEAYGLLDSAHEMERYLRQNLGKKIYKLEVDKNGMFSLRIDNYYQSTIADLMCLGRVKNLKELDLYWVKVGDVGMKHLEGLVHLRTLELECSQIGDQGLESLKGLKNLRELGLNGTQISDAGLQNLACLTGLRRLFLVGTQIGDAGLGYLKGLSGLEVLQLAGTQVSDGGLEHIKGLVNLRVLNLVNTRISDAGLKHLEGLVDLRDLYLRENPISDAGLKYLEGLGSLRCLDLKDTQVSDAGMTHLKRLKNLRKLSLWETQVSDAGVDELKRSIPRLRIER